jgi:hypothetical protein
MSLQRPRAGTCGRRRRPVVDSCSAPIVDDAGRTIAALDPSAYTGQVSVDMLIRVRPSELQQRAIELKCIIDGHTMLQQELRTEPAQKLAAALQRRPEGLYENDEV